jgi:diguanylate cyclase (GGDEF)-like protein
MLLSLISEIAFCLLGGCFMAREKKDGRRINYYLNRQIFEQLERYAEEKGQSMTTAIERILSEYFAEHSIRLDNSENVLQRAAAVSSEEVILENLPCGAGIYEVTDKGIRATYLNKRYRSYLQRSIGDLSEAPVFEVVHADDVDKLKAAIQTALKNEGEGSCDIRIADGADDYITFHVMGKIIRQSSTTTTIYVTYTPISESELLLIKRAETDGMTGIYNKITTEKLIKHHLSNEGNAPCILLMLDVDNLKAINDTMGHPQGDRAICAIADVLRAQFRKTDVIGRVGGDEFLAFLPGVDTPEKVNEILSKLYSCISDLSIGENNDISIQVSTGVAMGKTGEISFEELYSNADSALYYAKRSGKKQYCIYSKNDLR